MLHERSWMEMKAAAKNPQGHRGFWNVGSLGPWRATEFKPKDNWYHLVGVPQGTTQRGHLGKTFLSMIDKVSDCAFTSGSI